MGGRDADIGLKHSEQVQSSIGSYGLISSLGILWSAMLNGSLARNGQRKREGRGWTMREINNDDRLGNLSGVML